MYPARCASAVFLMWVVILFGSSAVMAVVVIVSWELAMSL